LAAPTRSSSSAAAGNPRATLSVVTGVLSVVTLPLAVFASRYSESYELIHAGLAIPAGALLGVLALRWAKAGRRRAELTLGRVGGEGSARLGRLLGIAGLWLAGAALVALAVYGTLEYIAST
jgi:hypothetical protein